MKTSTYHSHDVFNFDCLKSKVERGKPRSFLYSLLTLFLLLVAKFGWGQIQTFSTAGTYNWVCPPGVTSITVECWGGGGGGGGSRGLNTSGQYTHGGGGAGGGYVKNTSITVVPGTTYTIVVGSAGTAGSGGTTPSAGGKGGDSYFGSTSTLLAIGGNGGSARSTNGSAGGGTSVSSGNVGASDLFNYYGGAGGTGTTTNSGGGGGSAGTGSNGNDATNNTGGTAVTGGVAGRNGVSTNNNGLTGNSPGGGGSGARSGVTTLHYNGGAGGAGQVRITVNNTCLPLLQQNFTGSSTVADFVNSTSPNTGQFDAISSGANASVTISSGALLFTRSVTGAGTGAEATRITNLSGSPTSLILRFDVNVNVTAASSTTPLMGVYVGSGFSTGLAAPTNANVYARFGILPTSTTQWAIRRMTTTAATNGTNFNEITDYTLTFVLNNTGSSLTYSAPDGTIETIANDVVDLWVGTTRIWNDNGIETTSLNIEDHNYPKV